MRAPRLAAAANAVGLVAAGLTVTGGTAAAEGAGLFLMAVELGRNGPSGRQILTYSQSANPNSPSYADQTRLYSGKGWDTIKFTEQQLKADPNLVTYRGGAAGLTEDG